jgi:UDP-N-acetyl-D-galactosamine dehydrogenase
VPDLRNTKVVDIISELQDYGVKVVVSDPLADPQEAREYYGVDLQPLDRIRDLDAVILAVMHRVYLDEGLEGITGRCADANAPVIDVKGCFSPAEARKLGVSYWRL